MHTVSLDHAKQELEAVVARVLANAEPTVVNTPAGESVVVLPFNDLVMSRINCDTSVWQVLRWVFGSRVVCGDVR